MRRLFVLPALLIGILAGCGESDPAPVDEETVVVAALGDSITAGSPLWDPDPATRELIGERADERSQFEYWAEEADPTLEFRNCGVPGERTDEIALRLDDCAAGADALLVQGGINDIAQGRPVGEAAADLDTMVRAGQELGLPVTIVELLPWNSCHPEADPRVAELNREIARIGRNRDVPVLPFHETLEDPAEPGTMEAELTDDGNHPSIAGYRRLGEEAFGDLALPGG
jgi:lysophospholipase L1-like esterase